MSYIAIVYGTRPEAIKLAPLVKELRTGGGPHQIICTGQHSTLLENCPLPHDVRFELMEPSQKPAAFVARALTTLTDLWDGPDRPARVVVQGDTATAFAATLAAFHLGIPVAHVEAGLRSDDMAAPFPEEGYRVMIDRIATTHYVATERPARNLLDEGIDFRSIFITGNTGIDGAMAAAARGGRSAGVGKAPYVLATLHRREAFGEPMASVCRAIRMLADERLHFIVPMHPNPLARSVIREELGSNPNVSLIEPLPYDDLIATLRGAWATLTDSGGIQEEAPSFGIPVLVAREVTERPEAIESGNAQLVGWDMAAIVNFVRHLQSSPDVYRQMATVRHVFGDGHAAERIAQDLRRQLE